MRVLWLVRPGLERSGGGDATQILQTAAALRRLGVEVEIREKADAGEKRHGAYDLAHLFHLDRLWENLPHARVLGRSKIPYVLSTIWWPPNEFDRKARTGMQGWLSRRLGSTAYANLRVWQRALMHAAASRSLHALAGGLATFQAGAREMLQRAAVILPNSETEREQIERWFGVAPPSVVTPNAADHETFRPPVQVAVRQGVLCVGRIEPRKNQLALVEAMRDAPVRLTIVGPVGRYNRRYARKCRAAAGRNTTFLDAQPPVRLCELYQQAAVHACVSWYETPGLVSLEAALCGCAIVATEGGCTREYLRDQAEYAQADEPRSIRLAVERALAAGPTAGLAQRVRCDFTWEAAAQATLRGYELAMAQGKP